MDHPKPPTRPRKKPRRLKLCPDWAGRFCASFVWALVRLMGGHGG